MSEGPTARDLRDAHSVEQTEGRGEIQASVLSRQAFVLRREACVLRSQASDLLDTARSGIAQCSFEKLLVRGLGLGHAESSSPRGADTEGASATECVRPRTPLANGLSKIA